MKLLGVKGSGTGKVFATAIATGGVALLLWMKLRLVTGVPRSVYAAPDVAPTAPRELLTSDGRPIHDPPMCKLPPMECLGRE